MSRWSDPPTMSRRSDPPSGASPAVRAAVGAAGHLPAPPLLPATLVPATLLPATLLLAILFAATLPGTATADPAPSAPALDIGAPVQSVVAPVLDIVTSVADTRHQVTVDQSARRVRVTLDATVLFGKDSAAIRPGGAERIEQAVATIRTRASRAGDDRRLHRRPRVGATRPRPEPATGGRGGRHRHSGAARRAVLARRRRQGRGRSGGAQHVGGKSAAQPAGGHHVRVPLTLRTRTGQRTVG